MLRSNRINAWHLLLQAGVTTTMNGVNAAYLRSGAAAHHRRDGFIMCRSGVMSHGVHVVAGILRVHIDIGSRWEGLGPLATSPALMQSKRSR